MNIQETGKRITDRLTSARFVIVILFSVATCVGFLKKIVSAEAFLPLTLLIIKSYFDKDRTKINGENGEEKK